MLPFNDDPLWSSIRDFDIDGGPSPARFVARLAREQRWNTAHARRVIEEYRRFIYIAMKRDHRVSPSPAVDEVWHLHLIYTRSYWERFCGETLRRPLHHQPSRGTSDDRRVLAQAYADTLKSYREIFGVDAPRDIWPIRRKKRVTDTAARVFLWWRKTWERVNA